MLRTLRGRLIVSHVLPLLIAILLAGVALVYVLETQFVLVNVARQLAAQAALVTQLAGERAGIWQDPARAQEFAANVTSLSQADLMLLTREGTVLATSEPADAPAIGRRLALPGLAEVAAGGRYSGVRNGTSSQDEVAEAMAPVTGPDGRVVGVVRLSYDLGSVYDRFMRLRYLIAEILATSLLLGAAAGWILALTLARPLRRVTEATYGLATGRQLVALPEEGPEEVRRLLHAFNVLVGRLNALEEARRRLLANLVHELGRPLGAVRAATYALLDGAEDEPALRREFILGIEGEAQRLERLLEDLGEFREHLLGTLRLDRQNVALDEWLQQTLSPWRAAAEQKGLRWVADAAPGLPTVEIDPDRLGQALGNLLSNAVKYTPRGGEVRVEARRYDGKVGIVVADTGPGIPPAELDCIFEPFYRSQGSGSGPQGLGLGLTIARDLVTAHQGSLIAQSAPGAGSRFTIFLPISHDPAIPGVPPFPVTPPAA